MEALEAGGYLEAVFESKRIWDLRMEWLSEKSDDLALRWDVSLTMRIRDKLGISYDKTDELRYMLSHHRVGKQLRPMTWAINPWNGSRISYPQPIRPRSGVLGWAKLVSASQKRYGLSMDKAGKIAHSTHTVRVDTVHLAGSGPQTPTLTLGVGPEALHLHFSPLLLATLGPPGL